MKKNIGVIISISMLVSLLFISAIGTSNSSILVSDGIFRMYDEFTIVTNDTRCNLNLGANSSTLYRLCVNGKSYFTNDSLFGSSIEVNNDSYFYQDLSISELLTSKNINIINGQTLSFGIDSSHLETYLTTVTPDLFLIKSYLTNFNISGNEDLNLYARKTLNLSSDGSISIFVPTGQTIDVRGKIISNSTIGTSSILQGNQVISETSFEGWGTVPIGGTINWCNHIGSVVLSKPEGYWICNGSTIIDSDSIFNGQPSPNMTNRFIRGVNYSKTNTVNTGYMRGNNTALNVIGHTHTLNGGVTGVIKTVILNKNSYTLINGLVSVGTSLTTTTLGSTDSYGVNGYDSQPKFYDMVILVRIK